MPVCTCRNLLGVILKAYNYMVGNDTIAVVSARQYRVIQFSGKSPHILCMNVVLKFLFLTHSKGFNDLVD